MLPSRNLLKNELQMRPDGMGRTYTDFLATVGIELTDIGLYNPNAADRHDHYFQLEKQTYPSGFRHPQLFRDVQSILFSQANALKLHGPAQSTAAADPLTLNIIDRSKDLFLDWNEPDICLMATTFIGSNGGFVLATSGLAVHNEETNQFGRYFPGPKRNEGVIRNLLNMLHGESGDKRLPIDLDVHALISAIERNLLELIEECGKSRGDWTNLIAPEVREKCERRAAAGKNIMPWRAFLELADHLNTIGKNLDLFRPVFDKCGYPSSRNKIENETLETGELIRLRLLDSHVTKRVVTNHEFTRDDLITLDRILARTVRLRRAASDIERSRLEAR